MTTKNDKINLTVIKKILGIGNFFQTDQTSLEKTY